MTTRKFGLMHDGATVESIHIKGGGLSATILTWGGVLQDLRLSGHHAPLVLGFEQFAPYPQYSPNFGAIVGRCGNRINKGQFTLDGKTYQADTNFLGKHCLHGGIAGFSKRNWSIADVHPDHVTLFYDAYDGEMGFPGNLRAYCTYSLLDNGRMQIKLSATTDAPTLCNLAHHSYFNLEDGGRTSALNHQLTLHADHYLPVDAEGIPTGDINSVADSVMDFRSARAIQPAAMSVNYDHNYCLAPERRALTHVGTLSAPTSGISMQLWTTESGLQFYDGTRSQQDYPGLDGIIYQSNAGICLEPQIWPDAINQPHFPKAILNPNEIYEQITEYVFNRSRSDTTHIPAS